MIHFLKFLFISILINALVFSTANAENGVSNLKFHGNLTVVNCSVNDDTDTPMIEFGDVRTDLIDGTKYSQPLPVKITCAGDLSSLAIQYQIKGTAASFDTKVLNTNIAGLGIKVLNSTGTPLSINTWVDTTPSATFSLSVVPVKDGTTQLSGGEFNATATLVIQMK